MANGGARAFGGAGGCQWRTGWSTASGDAPDTKQPQTIASLKFTNIGSRSCTVRGFPGVDLVGGKGTWSLGRSTQKVEAVTVQRGASTYSPVYLAPAKDGTAQNFPVSSVRVTPPNATRTAILSWPWKSDLIGGKSAPYGTYLDPIGLHFGG
ncbi:hypothetical protein BIV57_00790 [Mangrovactinospora gilvigrisea]|uniref:DUF4232 domain-containing protein n=1 Tax=Mangrovactinospora gilvigrisea TaxID=1428644 RepID=A0A1J7BL29_9ACTN|nr:DUF4232 domain-containing protein [Mangrovactinospora gilvigrisea]OIV39411.1 hypothetical protein BIV57_00790 [Mangrovactinospora gilvigrisea]